MGSAKENMCIHKIPGSHHPHKSNPITQSSLYPLPKYSFPNLLKDAPVPHAQQR